MENSSATAIGTLYIVATPIGNLADISARAITTLSTVDCILAEDTRHSRHLLNALSLDKPLSSLHDHNEKEKSASIIAQLKNGKSFALVSDAGTPLISDPGFFLVRMARQEGITVAPIPGPCALISALCASGIPCDSFVFAGFLPAKSSARQEKLRQFHKYDHTVIVYESTHRILACLDDIQAVNGAHYSLILAKEISKAFEHFMHAPVPEIKQWLEAEQGRTKGEFVLVLPITDTMSTDIGDAQILNLLLAELPLKKAVEIAASLSTTAKNLLYKKALFLKKEIDNLEAND